MSRKLTILRVNNEVNQPWLWPPSRKTSHLQCTTMGPAYDGLTALTFLRNFSMPMGENGTPKSGQLVKWSWVTSRGARGPSLPCCEAQTHKGYTCAWIMIPAQTHIRLHQAEGKDYFTSSGHGSWLFNPWNVNKWGKILITISQNSKWHLQIVSLFQPTVQTLYLT